MGLDRLLLFCYAILSCIFRCNSAGYFSLKRCWKQHLFTCFCVAARPDAGEIRFHRQRIFIRDKKMPRRGVAGALQRGRSQKICEPLKICSRSWRICDNRHLCREPAARFYLLYNFINSLIQGFYYSCERKATSIGIALQHNLQAVVSQTNAIRIRGGTSRFTKLPLIFLRLALVCPESQRPQAVLDRGRLE